MTTEQVEQTSIRFSDLYAAYDERLRLMQIRLETAKRNVASPITIELAFWYAVEPMQELLHMLEESAFGERLSQFKLGNRVEQRTSL